ncbi:asteroid [Schizosaccharomyces japonicus yFS275]|uniref:Asteroid n=1 Tax=Schizosaccharomyces japonicus (strain yFS275 / FY16936) TaxID=402676 RepID=B6JV48_SCHJY|nr:asteroid [Schizosaccharomyces japonicus yFS275]EEB05249.1 asteroid [Schizosaccharomyces japonicus yFS275]
MGVPRLGRFLEKYGTVQQFTSTPDGAGHTAVIDGPAFAYWLWFARDLGEEQYFDYENAVRWFHRWLQTTGFKHIEYIFDGGLPYSKNEVREHRYKQATNIDTKMLPHFCVPIAQHILKNELSGNVIVCNQEADKFCAVRAHKLDAFIFSQDSDLLVFNLENESGGYIPFQTISLTKTGFVATVYRYKDIQKHISFPLHLLAAAMGVEGHPEMEIDQHSSFTKICSDVEKALKDGTLESMIPKTEVERVVKYYSLEDPELTDTGDSLTWGRIQEAFHCSTDVPCVWLPQQKELPSARCSWIEGAALRIQAYANFRAQGRLQSRQLREFYRSYQELHSNDVDIDFEYSDGWPYLANKFAGWPFAQRFILSAIRCMNGITNISLVSLLLMFSVCLSKKNILLDDKVSPSKAGISVVSRFMASTYSLSMLFFSANDTREDLQSFSPLSHCCNFVYYHHFLYKIKTGRKPSSLVPDRDTAKLAYNMYKALLADGFKVEIVMSIWEKSLSGSKRKRALNSKKET